MSDFRRFCATYAFICIGTCIANLVGAGKPMSMGYTVSTMFIASAAGAISVILAGKKDADP